MIDNTKRNGHVLERLPNTTNISFSGVTSEAILLLLDQEGICASSGSACLADSEQPSHVIKAMNSDGENDMEALRFSLGIESTLEQIIATQHAVRKFTHMLRSF